MNIRAKIFGGASPVEEPILGTKKPKGAKADALHSVKVRRESGRRANSRAEDRHRFVNERARVTHDGACHNVQLINVSGGGAMIDCDFEANCWDRVDLHLGDHGTIECAVLWVKERRLGLAFSQETRLDCSADQQAEVLRDVIRRNFPEVKFEDRSVPAPAMEEPPIMRAPEEQRRDTRHPLIWSGVLHYDYESRPVRLRNISSMGATIEMKFSIEPGAEPLLDLGDAGSIFGTVAWAVGDKVGLRFKQPFDVALLAKSKPQLAAAKWDPPSHIKKHMQTGGPVKSHLDRLSPSELNETLEGFLKH